MREAIAFHIEGMLAEGYADTGTFKPIELCGSCRLIGLFPTISNASVPNKK